MAPLAAVVLGLLSIFVRSIGSFPLTSVGSDLAFSSTSIHLTLIFSKHESGILVQFDLFMFIVFLCVWVITLKIVQKAMTSARVNLLASFATFVGFASVVVEMVIRGM